MFIGAMMARIGPMSYLAVCPLVKVLKTWDFSLNPCITEFGFVIDLAAAFLD
jgi:hypothetical protein